MENSKFYALVDKNGDKWFLETTSVPYRNEEEEKWEDGDVGYWDYVEELMPIYQNMFNYYAPNLTWENEPVEIPSLSISKFIIDMYKKEGFKYFILKIEDLSEALDSIELSEFFEFMDKYNSYRNNKGKEPNSYWVINRDEVPDIKTFEEFKERVVK